MIFQLYRTINDKPMSLGYFETDAEEYVLSDMISALQNDARLDMNGLQKAVPTILKARGYFCESCDVSKFGY